MQTTTTTSDSDQVYVLPLELIEPGDNDRKHFANLAELAESIREHGLAQPITVRPLPSEEGMVLPGTERPVRFEIVCGERRYRASKLAGLPTIRAMVREMDDRTASAIMLVENTGREDLDPIEEAEGYQKRIAQFGLSVAEVAAWAGVSAQQVSLRLKLLDLIPEAQFLTTKGSLPIGFAPMLSGLDANRQQLALAAWRQSSGSLNWWSWDSLCKRLRTEQDQDSMFDADSFLQVEEFVLTARQTTTPTASLRKLAAQMADALEAAGLAPELVAQARAATTK